jgi:hypothetical protein
MLRFFLAGVLLLSSFAPAVAQDHGPSPAYTADTQPYAAPAASWAAARALIGKSCATGYYDARTFPGFAKLTGPPAAILPVFSHDYVVVPRQRADARFAFLLSAKNADLKHCRIADVVVLPAVGEANFDLQCVNDSVGSTGFGVGQGAAHALVAFWSIEPNAKGLFLEREPIHVLGLSSIRCQQPETGE